MKFRFSRAAAGAALCFALHSARIHAQTPPPSSPPVQPPTAQQPAAEPASPAQHNSKTIFHRSIDADGQTVSDSGPSTAQPEIKSVDAPSAEDAERRAVTFTALDLDVHLRPAEQQIAVRAQLTVRNDGNAPLARIPLQISSSLTWERIRVDSKDVALTVATLNSDVDHTGQLHEAAIPLASPLAPGAIARLDATYFGTIALDPRRLLAIGTPDDAAAHSDWDRIGIDFTGLRGFGNVVWYPVSSVPVILGDGARVFDEIGQHKLRLFGARFTMRLAIEFNPGDAPTVALVNGRSLDLKVTNPVEGQQVNGVATATLQSTTLGFEAPSLFAAIRVAHAGPNATIFALTDSESPVSAPPVDAWLSAAAAVAPFIEGWLGKRQQAQLSLLDLPDAKDAPFETGALLAIPVRPADPAQLQGVLVHALTHAFLRPAATPPPAWLDEGAATFLSTLWTEKQVGRTEALESLEASRSALALAEPESPGSSAGQPLGQTTSPAYYRTKAAYVLWMLRDIAGDPALSDAMRRISEPALVPPAGDHPAIAMQAPPLVEPRAFEQFLERSARQDLAWFFSDWVSADKGLPDLSIESVFPTAGAQGSWLITVNLANTGYAAANVPLTVRSRGTSATQRVLIPARGKVTQHMILQDKPTEVQLNDGVTPETQATVHITSLDQPGASSSSSASPQP